LNLPLAVRHAISAAPVVDLHTHLFSPQLEGMNLFGIDELLTYHYLIAEVLRFDPVSPEWLFAQPKSAQADLIWNALFVKRTPISEAANGVISVLSALGLDTNAPDLKEAREFFADRDPQKHIDEVLRISGVRYLTMTNDPLDPVERSSWERNPDIDPRFLSALRIDPIVNDWQMAVGPLTGLGYSVSPALTDKDVAEVRRYFEDWIAKMRPRYLAISLPAEFEYPEDSHRARLLKQAVLPTCREQGLPFAMMMGVRRKVNPSLKSAGDGVGVSDLGALERLALENEQNRFLVTTLSRENAHALCVSARKFANILPFGCWWFMNNPSLVEEVTLMRLEMLGQSFVPQHSDARIFDQLIYKWQHSRRSIASALIKRYEALEASGRAITETDIERDASALMGGTAAAWLGLEW
jgi:hypothetical protein